MTSPIAIVSVIDQEQHLSRFFSKLFSEALHLGVDRVLLRKAGETVHISFRKGDSELRNFELKGQWFTPLWQWLCERNSVFRRPKALDKDVGRALGLISLLPKERAKRETHKFEAAVRIGGELLIVNCEKVNPLKGEEQLIMNQFLSLPLPRALSQLGVLEPQTHGFRTLISKSDGLLIIAAPDEKQLASGTAMALSLTSGCLLHNLALLKEFSEKDVQTQLALRAQPILFIVGVRSEEVLDALLQLRQFGVAPTSSVVNGIICHGFVRQVCSACGRETIFDPKLIEALPEGLRPKRDATYIVGRGCDLCGHSGFDGSIGVQSVLVMDETVRGTLPARLSETAQPKEGEQLSFLEVAYRSGMRSLLADGLHKVYAGLTTLESLYELTSVLPPAYHKLYKQTRVSEALAAGTETRAPAQPRSTESDATPTISLNITPKRHDRSSGGAARRPMLLIVEDDPDQQSILEMVFRSAEYDLVTANDGVEALAALRKEIPDLIITDLMMPHMDGREFVSRLKLQEQYRDIPVMVLTVVSDSDKEYDLLDLGADDYCEKTIQRNVLLKRVENLIKRARGV